MVFYLLIADNCFIEEKYCIKILSQGRFLVSHTCCLVESTVVHCIMAQPKNTRGIIITEDITDDVLQFPSAEQLMVIINNGNNYSCINCCCI